MIRHTANVPSVGCLQSALSPIRLVRMFGADARCADSPTYPSAQPSLMQRRKPQHGFIQEAVTPDRIPAVFPRGRRCRSCRTVLSIYNHADWCWQCKPQGRTIRGNRSRDQLESMDDLRELMEAA